MEEVNKTNEEVPVDKRTIQEIKESLLALEVGSFTYQDQRKARAYYDYVKVKEACAFSPNELLQVEEMLDICPTEMFESDRPERQEGESTYQYKWRRKRMNAWKKHRQVFVFVSGTKNTRKGMGKTFRKSDFTQGELLGSHVAAVMKLKGMDPNTVMKEAKEKEVKGDK